MTPLTSRPSGPLAGHIRVPGDKSISQRALILGYGLARPVLETLSLAARRLRPLVRDKARTFACFCLLLLALQAHAAAPHMAAYAAKTRDLLASRVIHVLAPA